MVILLSELQSFVSGFFSAPQFCIHRSCLYQQQLCLDVFNKFWMCWRGLLQLNTANLAGIYDFCHISKLAIVQIL